MSPIANETSPVLDRFDPASLRLSQHFKAGAVDKLITEIPVRKPDPVNFFRVHPDPEYHLDVLIFEDKIKLRTYLIAPALAEEFGSLAKPKIIYPVINRVGVLTLW